MHAGRHYTLGEVVYWTRRETAVFLVWSCLPVAATALGFELPHLPWQPILLVGTALAFLTGFKSNAAYARLWEARQIWGGIVNTSRTFVVLERDFIDDADGSTHTKLGHRHIAWMTALRFQLREARVWEAQGSTANREYQAQYFKVAEHQTTLAVALEGLLDAEDLQWVLARKNRAAALLSLQSRDLRHLCDEGRLSELRHVELTRLIEALYTHQGKCERIKNFPYPRQFATLNLIFVWQFIALLPFGLLTEFRKLGDGWMWLLVPFTALVAWVFHTMDKIGSVSENPFEGGANDVPITAMSRGIEIDVRDLLGETDLPAPLGPAGNILL